MRRAAIVFAVLSLAACASKQKTFISNTYVRPQRIAVLPMTNETNDLDGPAIVRQALFNALALRGFAMIPLEDVDQKLQVQGFTDGGQLKATTPQKIGEWVGADGLFYSTLEEFNYIILGYYAQRVVQIKGQMVNAASGEDLWVASRGWSTRTIATNKDEAAKSFAVQMAAKAVEKMTKIPLQFETREAVRRLMDTLPQ